MKPPRPRPDCGRTRKVLDDLVDRELSPADMRIAERHLATCEECTRRHAFDAALIRELRIRIGQVPVSRDSIDRIVAALERARAGGNLPS